MKIAGMVKTSCIDFPGRLAVVIFTPGCNYDCWYCHNRMLLGKPATLWDEGEVRDLLEKRAGMMDGVAVSGGEPTLQEDLCEFLAYVKELCYETKLDTNGSRPDVLRKILNMKLADYIALDYKAPWDAYPDVCGRDADPGLVKKTMEMLCESDIEWEARTTVMPGLTPEDLRTMASEAPVLPKYILQRYREPANNQMDVRQRNALPVYTTQELVELTASLKTAQPNITVREASLKSAI